MKRFTLAAFCLALLGICAVATNAQTTFNNTTAIPIADRVGTTPGVGNPYPSNITVSGLSGNVTKVTVTIRNLTHTFPDDVELLLVSPSNKALILQSDTMGGTPASNLTYTFDQAAPNQIADSAQPANNSSVRPGNYAGNGGAAFDVFPAPAPQPPYINPGPEAGGTPGNLDSFNGDPANGTWSLYAIDDEGLDTGGISGGWSITITAQGTPQCTRRIEFDFDADCRTDYAVARANAGAINWYILRSSDNTVQFQNWGATTDVLAPGDFNGDRRFDFNVWRSGAQALYFLQLNGGASTTIPWGTTNDRAGGRIEGDFDGDGSDDPTVVRTVSGALVWYIRQSSNGQVQAITFGVSTAPADTPLAAADWDGDGRDDLAVYRQVAGAADQYIIRQSTNGQQRIIPFGEFATDAIMAEDMDGDNRADPVIWRTFAPATAADQGFWYILQSSNNQVRAVRFGAVGTTTQFGDVPVPGDYTGDGRVDIAIWRPSTGTYFYYQETPVAAIARQFGASTDTPLQFLRVR